MEERRKSPASRACSSADMEVGLRMPSLQFCILGTPCLRTFFFSAAVFFCCFFLTPLSLNNAIEERVREAVITSWRRSLTCSMGPLLFFRHQHRSQQGKRQLSTLPTEWIADDSENPLHFSSVRKWFVVVSISLFCFWISFSSSEFIGAIPGIMNDFDVSSLVAIVGVSMVLLGFTLGPLFLAPLSEMYGRKPVYVACMAVFTLFQIGCALAENIETILICRFFIGLAGSGPLTNGAGSLADVFVARDRARAMTLYVGTIFLGPGDWSHCRIGHHRDTDFVAVGLLDCAGGGSAADGAGVSDARDVRPGAAEEALEKTPFGDGEKPQIGGRLAGDGAVAVGHVLKLNLTRPFSIAFRRNSLCCCCRSGSPSFTAFCIFFSRPFLSSMCKCTDSTHSRRRFLSSALESGCYLV